VLLLYLNLRAIERIIEGLSSTMVNPATKVAA